MYNNTNPAELYSGTTWELLANDKYLKTTTGTPLSIGGSNSFTIQKANLPATKLQVESFSLTRGTMNIVGDFSLENPKNQPPTGAFYQSETFKQAVSGSYASRNRIAFDASRSWSGSTSSSAPYTQNLGSGTAISINPTYITVKAWKRLS